MKLYSYYIYKDKVIEDEGNIEFVKRKMFVLNEKAMGIQLCVLFCDINKFCFFQKLTESEKIKLRKSGNLSE